MIKRFYVKNFSSIKDAMDISFEASKIEDNTFYNNYFSFRDSNILKVSAFYGMNATGKTRIVMAFAALRELVVGGMILGPKLPYSPFKFDQKSKNEPIVLGIEFSFDNRPTSSIFRYFVSYDDKNILSEKLEKLASQKPSLLFERVVGENGQPNVRLGTTVQNNVLLKAIKDSVVRDQTFLSMFSQFRIEDFYEAFSFFAQSIINISPIVTRFDDVLPDKIIRDEKFKDFTLKLLKAADFNITNLSVGKSAIHPKRNIGQGFVAERDALILTHKGDCSSGSLEFIEESLGTKKIIILAAHLYPALCKPSVFIVDELESSLHPELTKLIVKCFLDETINPFNSQLIFTSHETSLLNLNLLRRDQINFVYKDRNTCGTFIKSLKDFHVRKTDSIEKSYLAGRYLTTPEIKENLLEDYFNAD